jgi:hypothetical protein
MYSWEGPKKAAVAGHVVPIFVPYVSTSTKYVRGGRKNPKFAKKSKIRQKSSNLPKKSLKSLNLPKSQFFPKKNKFLQ